MNDGIVFAEHMLAEHGEFYPFGRTLTTDGRIQVVGAQASTDHPKSQELIDMLLQAFRTGAQAGEHRAIALFFDVRVQHPGTREKVDAVQVGVEHRDGYCADVFFPYTLERGTPRFGAVFAQRRDGVVYADA